MKNKKVPIVIVLFVIILIASYFSFTHYKKYYGQAVPHCGLDGEFDQCYQDDKQ